ncbi:MAG: hypothetical protein H6711_02410 [Myxococcales bacterium]|nr:hypothetical protein [Myxococcales bacterium]
MTTILRLRHAALAAALLLACSGDDPETTQGSTSSASASASVSASSTSGASASASASSTSKGSTTANVSGSGTATDGSGTTCDGDCGSGSGTTTGGKITGCYPPDNPCPEGQKCTFDGDFSHTQCVPIDPRPKGLGDACQNEGPLASGLDNCGDGLLCWNLDPDTGIGECVAFCAFEGEYCPLDATSSCMWCQECALGVCVPGCDPLLQDCQNGAACLPSNDAFTCIDLAMEGQQGDPCEYVNVCAPGLFCADASYVPGCEGNGCCTAFCDLQDPQCPDQTVCTPWYEGAPPDLYADVGACVVPMP